MDGMVSGTARRTVVQLGGLDGEDDAVMQGKVRL